MRYRSDHRRGSPAPMSLWRLLQCGEYKTPVRSRGPFSLTTCLPPPRIPRSPQASEYPVVS
ncbi:hypothetical protein GDO81_028844 [Engystomops pustulosus]|nr:hypothetical protein GDO81_028844 [Engystomops pustulosus]KAG8547206.1 hypothetical protein GDO81_028844 [Engystomops pustulosus]